MEKLHRADMQMDAEPAVAPASHRAIAIDDDATAAARQSEVQRRALAGGAVVQAEGPVEASDDRVHQAAAVGIAGAGARLPHLDRIQRSFGSYDLAGVRAHVGGGAARACQEIGATAFATGNDVAFGRSPDLHTAAHEAAHVVQQRGGVHLAGGVGREGDAYERHADAVADRVVAGDSAEDLLAEMSPAPAGDGGAVQMKKDTLGSGDEAFEAMWAAHPHNYRDNPEENTSSEQVREDHGLPDSYENTCAIRLSIMLNGSGHTITPARTAAAGLARRPHYSAKTKQYYILSAKEMWTYLEKHFRRADVMFPHSGRFKDEEAFNEAFESTIRPAIQGAKGIVAFDKIFSYGGTGHVDLFDGESLSDAGGWYPSQRLHIWYVSVP